MTAQAVRLVAAVVPVVGGKGGETVAWTEVMKVKRKSQQLRFACV